jgi:hypothetical protein
MPNFRRPSIISFVMSEGPKSHVLLSHILCFLYSNEVSDGGLNTTKFLRKLLCLCTSNHTLLKVHRPSTCPNAEEMVMRTKESSPAWKRTSRRSHFQDLAAAKRERRQAPTKRKLSTKEQCRKQRQRKQWLKWGWGSLHLPPPYIAPALALQLPGPTIISVQKNDGSRATAVNQVATRHQRSGLIQVTQEEASACANASVPQNLKTRF